MGLFSRLFGGHQSNTPQEVEPTEYKGFLIYAEARSESGQYRICGRIAKESESGTQIHQFIRSDVLSSKDEANELMINKAKTYIDQMGSNIF